MHPQVSRLYEAAERLAMAKTPAAVARLLKTSQQTIKNWEARGISKDGLLIAQREIGVSAEWLATGDGEMRMTHLSNIKVIHPDDDLPEGMVSIPSFNIKFSAGNGYVQTEYEELEEAESAAYKLNWFHTERINPKNAKRFKVTGDSMEPLLYSGDTILVDMSDTRIQDGKVYAIRYGHEMRVKRLYVRLDGTLTLRSDNQAYKDEDVPQAIAQEHITILGRVRDKSGNGGL